MVSWRRSTWAMVGWTTVGAAVASRGWEAGDPMAIAGAGAVWLLGVVPLGLVSCLTYRVDVRANRIAAARRAAEGLSEAAVPSWALASDQTSVGLTWRPGSTGRLPAGATRLGDRGPGRVPPEERDVRGETASRVRVRRSSTTRPGPATRSARESHPANRASGPSSSGPSRVERP
jgi:hypothetical protein